MEGSIAKHLLNSFLILLAITSLINSSSADTRFYPVPPKSVSTEFIKTSCSSTTYPRLCYTTLARHASLIQTSPKLLAHVALNVTLATAKSTSAVMLNLSKGSGMNPREVEAMQDCLEELSDSVDEIRSAALTDETTCRDGFEGNTVNGKMVRSRIVNIAHMTSNALSLINSYASVHS
ncbi:hypothetical protein Pint_17248 [Pistacia integerrima]|uniref:Uncharacterized protein n=1 Tax=Pistacia integerrima TaxID=434235 RepID=A0ACC0YW33_9ROSI|nr:hypothetical protein Pint_17248 [Pistacia integerrima]